MPFCGNCGNTMLVGEAFCGECGTPAPKAATEATANNEEARLQKTLGKIASGSVGAGRTITQKPPLNSEPKTSAPKTTTSSAPTSKPAPSSTSTQSSGGLNLKFCSSCGSQVSGAGAFCSECGTPVSGGSKSQSSSPSRAQSTQPSTQSSSNNVITFDTPQSCGRCGETIEGPAYQFQGKNYHESCWRCAGCQSSLNGIPFGLKDGAPWCKDCNFGRPKEFCPGCGQIIAEGKFTKAMDMTWHYDCFVCSSCSTPISKVGGFIVRDDKPVCKNCV